MTETSEDREPTLLYDASDGRFCLWRRADQILRLTVEEAWGLSVALDFWVLAMDPDETRPRQDEADGE